MTANAPVWAWLIAAVVGSGFITALAPVVLEALKGKARTSAEIQSIEASTLVSLQPVWNETVKYLQSEIDALREEIDQAKAEIRRLTNRVDRYRSELSKNGIPIPETE